MPPPNKFFAQRRAFVRRYKKHYGLGPSIKTKDLDRQLLAAEEAVVAVHEALRGGAAQLSRAEKAVRSLALIVTPESPGPVKQHLESSQQKIEDLKTTTPS